MGKVCNVTTPISAVNGITINRTKACDASNYTNVDSRNIEYLVFHYTGNSKDTAKANANYFMGANREASAHYFVDDTSIWQSVDANDRAWHCGTRGTYYHDSCRNTNSIGIEMCCTAGNYKIGEKALENAAQLGAALCKYFGITDVDKYVLRHYDITHKSCPAQMIGANNAEWNAFKARIKEIMNPPAAVVLTAGDKLTLSKVALYASSSAKIKSSSKTGTYYVWSPSVFNNRIRITNSAANVGKAGQVTGWINVNDAKNALSVPAAKTLTAGAKLTLKSIPLYTSSSAKTKSSTKTGTYYVWSSVSVNNRIRITNSVSKVGKSGQITGWITVSDAKKSL